MTMGSAASGLNAVLARMNAIESNFQALNDIVFEIDLKQQAAVENPQNSEFKTVLDGKINAVENNAQQISREDLPVYDDEVTSVNEEISDNKIKEIEAQTDNNSQLENKNVPFKTDDMALILENGIIPDDSDDIKIEPVNLKSKIKINPKSANIDSIIENISSKYNLDSDFIKAVIKQESGFNPNATSKKGAMGLMQLMPATAKSLGISDAYNPEQNIEGGVKHLKNLLDKYNNNQELALAAYNAGSSAVQKYGGIPPYKETQNYVKSIMAAYNKVKEAKI